MSAAKAASDTTTKAEIVARLALAPADSQAKKTSHAAKQVPPAVLWLDPLQPDPGAPVTPGHFSLLQKNKMFTPHVLVVPVGSTVAFPNADPFFHNVFSLFDGRRFDLGLYESGSTRDVVFSRVGVSYIFCNIHSEMSAVVLSLATPYYGFADGQGRFHLLGVPDGEYELHVWIEGQKQSSLDRFTRRAHISGKVADLGRIPIDSPQEKDHKNKFGEPYNTETHPIY